MKKVFKIIFSVLLAMAIIAPIKAYCLPITGDNIRDDIGAQYEDENVIRQDVPEDNFTEEDLQDQDNNATLNKLKEVGAVKGPYAFADMDSLSEIIGAAIKAFLSLLGVIFLVLMIYAGFHWMTAQGDEQKVEKAKNTIVRAIVGLVIVVGAYAIWAFIKSYFIF